VKSSDARLRLSRLTRFVYELLLELGALLELKVESASSRFQTSDLLIPFLATER